MEYKLIECEINSCTGKDITNEKRYIDKDKNKSEFVLVEDNLIVPGFYEQYDILMKQLHK